MNWTDLLRKLDGSDEILVKKLARNDCSWADSRSSHQNGVYIPKEVKDFFPSLHNVNSSKPHIFESRIRTLWPDTGEVRESRLTHYSNKGAELHLTRIPKDQFSGLTPASLLIIGNEDASTNDLPTYWFVVLDAASEEAESFEAMFSLEVGFHYAVFRPAEQIRRDQDELASLIDEVDAAVRADRLGEFLATAAKLPRPEYFASRAQALFLERIGGSSMNPYVLTNPGDALMTISRDVEFSLYKSAERRHRAAQVVEILLSEGADQGTRALVSAVIRGFARLDAAFLSASQHRKSRAGRSFENHIARLLTDGDILFEEQSVTGGRRPDFVIPSVEALGREHRDRGDAFVLSAKTTLRERWKQVVLEQFECDLFLATVDDRVSASAIEDMESHGVVLVVPESLKASPETFYGNSANVITFTDFFNALATERRSVFAATAPS